MAQMKGRNKTVLGLFVDGLDVKLAHLSIKGKRITVNELKSATLATKLHEHKAAELAVGEMGDSADPFSISAGPATDEVAVESPSEDNNAVLLGGSFANIGSTPRAYLAAMIVAGAETPGKQSP